MPFNDSPVIRVMRREYRRLFGNKATFLLLTIYPALLFFCVAYIYQNRVVTDIPIGICDLDKSELSHTIILSIESTRSLKIEQYLFSEKEIEDKIRSGKIQGAFIIPANLESDIKSGGQGTITVYKNTANLIIGNMILKDASSIIQTISSGIMIKRLEGRGLNPNQALALANPIRIDSYPLFNPGYNYANYLPPGVIMVMLQMLIMIIGVLAINEEINSGTIGELFATAGGNIRAILLGKLFAHASIYLGIGLIALGFIWPLFDIPMVGSSLLAVGLLLAFILASLSLSFAVSCVLGNKFIAADFAALYNSPAFLFSGYTYPLWAMPKAHYIYAQLLPFTHFLSGFIKVYSMGSPGKYLLPEFGNLAIFIFVGFTVSLLMLKFKVKPAALSQMPVAEKAR